METSTTSCSSLLEMVDKEMSSNHAREKQVEQHKVNVCCGDMVIIVVHNAKTLLDAKSFVRSVSYGTNGIESGKRDS